MFDSEPPLILTLHLDQSAAGFFNHLRRSYFPPDRNYLDAHVTLFHHLPGNQLDQITRDLRDLCDRESVLQVTVVKVRSIGRGVAYDLAAPALQSLRRALVTRWQPYLTPQDSQPFHPHITVQNKVDKEDARKLLEKLAAGFQSWTFSATGLDLWRYKGGPWDHLSYFPFTEDAEKS